MLFLQKIKILNITSCEGLAGFAPNRTQRRPSEKAFTIKTLHLGSLVIKMPRLRNSIHSGDIRYGQ